MTDLLTEQDIADIRADLQMEELALELHLNKEPLPHMVEQHKARTFASYVEIKRLKDMLR